MKFTHLHVHSHYSLLDGLAQIDHLIKRATELGMDSLAITDHGALYGAIEFYQKATKAGIKPIIGLEAYVASEGMRNKRPGIDDKRCHLTLLAYTTQGYYNLLKMVTTSHLEGYYYKPRVDHDLLREYHEGVIALSGCLGGEIPRAIQLKKPEAAERLIHEYQDIFGKDNFYLEIMPNENAGDRDDQKLVNAALADMSARTGARLAATGDIHYIGADDREAQDILVSVQTGNKFEDENRFTMKEASLYMRSGDEMAALLPQYPEAIARTQEIAARVNIEIPLGNWTFPHLEIPPDTTHDEELRKTAYGGLAKRGLSLDTPGLRDRIEYELKIITDKGFSPYFLVVADLLHFAHHNGILTNVRGSVAGSMVTYLTGITDVNPFDYNLPFERFLNPERPSAPDIDMDFADNRRDEVIAYARRKYGEEHVAQIGTFGTMMARAAVRDVARALGYAYAVGDRIAKAIPMGSQGFPMTIDHALEITPELKEMYDTEGDIKRIIDQARKMEGCVRHVSVHAAGVVIAPRPLREYVPLQFDPHGGRIITQYDMYAVEAVGLLKFDFLGIRNLAILADAVGLVKKFRGVAVDLGRIPLDDKRTFALLSRGETMGLFQLNGSGMTSSLKNLKPTTIHDINVMVALYRPGPINNIDEYIARKHGKKPVTYLHPKMKNFLDRTYGVLVYQDDLLMAAIELAGYSWGEVDKFRKAVGKKIPEEMAKQHTIFIEGCRAHSGMSAIEAEKIWDLFEPFQGYGFNKAHAASYGIFAYQTAYMKANFPGEYMTAVLTADSGDTEKVAEIIAECTRMKIPVLPPNVNESYARFTMIKGEDEDGDKIRFGLETIKNVGANIVSAIIEEREHNGRFATIEDFVERIRHKDLNKKSLESLVKCGALDELGERGAMLGNMDMLLDYNRETQRAAAGGQVSLFSQAAQPSVPSLRLRDMPPATKQEKLQWEKELLGLYVSAHPLHDYADRFAKYNVTPLGNLTSELRNKVVSVGGIVSGIRKITTKSGDQMLFVKLEDFTAKTEVLVFPKVLAQNPNIWQPEKMLFIKGRVSDKDGAMKILCENVAEIT